MARIIIFTCAMLYSVSVYSEELPRLQINKLIPLEQCVYKAKLAAAASWLRITKKATDCNSIKIHWHEDETEYEINFIKEWTCVGFRLDKDPIKTGDTVYLDCIKKLP
tara:strand:- start:716 stop:1039 length:324 start_codon:yes stop_codon:yes gene_type:complete